MNAIFLWFSAMDNALLYASGNCPADKIEERINFALRYASLYWAESDDEQYGKYAAANELCIYFGGGGYSSSL